MLYGKKQLKNIARETVEIQDQCFYKTERRVVDIEKDQRLSENYSTLITPYKWNEIIDNLHFQARKSTTEYELVNASVIKVISDTVASGGRIGVLNFASAKNPCGGFLEGSMAQEEALAISSGLYSTQLMHMKYYHNNRKFKSMTYTDHAIYSPDVVFFRDADFGLLEYPINASVLTLPAVNMKQVRVKGEDEDTAKTVMRNRMELALCALAHYRNDKIILGAYGCGVFGNDPNEIATWWKELLSDEGYGSYFDKVIFAVSDRQDGDNIKAFKSVFGDV